ncbi:MAG TPA: hypothetical protein VK028_01250 [Micromonosporaceae bacterium]|nr:hypothetical protein [Micromonosporaceae bacterium]
MGRLRLRHRPHRRVVLQGPPDQGSDSEHSRDKTHQLRSVTVELHELEHHPHPEEDHGG